MTNLIDKYLSEEEECPEGQKYWKVKQKCIPVRSTVEGIEVYLKEDEVPHIKDVSKKDVLNEDQKTLKDLDITGKELEKFLKDNNYKVITAVDKLKLTKLRKKIIKLNKKIGLDQFTGHYTGL